MGCAAFRLVAIAVAALAIVAVVGSGRDFVHVARISQPSRNSERPPKPIA